MSSWVCNTCEVGFLPKAGIAELLPKIVSASNGFFLWLLLSAMTIIVNE
jgi:hypothetical protein